MRIFQINPIYLGKPSASRDEILPQEFHHQIDGAYGIPHANIAAAAVLPRVKREAGMVVIVKSAGYDTGSVGGACGNEKV